MQNIVGFDGDTATIYVWSAKRKHNLRCIIDRADLETVSQISGLWYANPARSPKGKFYVEAKVWDGAARTARTVMMHRLILGLTDPAIEVDHRDNDGLNNRRENLRLCSHQQNLRFRSPKKDWAVYDAKQAAKAECRAERAIGAAIAKEFSISRAMAWAIRSRATISTPAAIEYHRRTVAAGVRNLRDLRAAFPNSGPKFGISSSGVK